MLLHWKILIDQYRKKCIKCIYFKKKGLPRGQLVSSMKFLFRNRERFSIDLLVLSFQGALTSCLAGHCSEEPWILKNIVHCIFFWLVFKPIFFFSPNYFWIVDVAVQIFSGRYLLKIINQVSSKIN